MSKAPKQPSQRDDLKRWDDEGGAPRSGHPSHESHPVLYYFNIRTERGVVEDSEGDTHASLHAARDAALAKAREMMAEGDQKGEDRRGWRFEIMDRANQHVLTVAFADALNRKTTNEAEGI